VTQQTAAEAQRNEQRSMLRGRPWPPGTSGNPSGSTVSKRVTVLFDAMLADFGEGALSAIDSAMLLQACRLLVRSERTADADSAVRLSNAAARLIAGLRSAKRREPAGETFADIAARAQEEADQRRARELAEDDAEPSFASPMEAPSPDAILGDTSARESAFDSASAPAEAVEDDDDQAES
jgi:hypothetical protein